MNGGGGGVCVFDDGGVDVVRWVCFVLCVCFCFVCVFLFWWRWRRREMIDGLVCECECV